MRAAMVLALALALCVTPRAGACVAGICSCPFEAVHFIQGQPNRLKCEDAGMLAVPKNRCLEARNAVRLPTATQMVSLDNTDRGPPAGCSANVVAIKENPERFTAAVWNDGKEVTEPSRTRARSQGRLPARPPVDRVAIRVGNNRAHTRTPTHTAAETRHVNRRAQPSARLDTRDGG